MAINSTRITEVGKNRIEGAFTTDGVVLPNTTGTIATPVFGAGNVLVSVADTGPVNIGDVIKFDGAGPSGANLICAIVAVPTGQINLQGTRVSTAVAASPITVLPFLFVKHNVKRISMCNFTTGDSWEWSELMGYGAALKKSASGTQTSTATEGFYVRGGCVYLHPALYAINSSYMFSMDY